MNKTLKTSLNVVFQASQRKWKTPSPLKKLVLGVHWPFAESTWTNNLFSFNVCPLDCIPTTGSTGKQSSLNNLVEKRVLEINNIYDCTLLEIIYEKKEQKNTWQIYGIVPSRVNRPDFSLHTDTHTQIMKGTKLLAHDTG
jgi:hypothetical protein